METFTEYLDSFYTEQTANSYQRVVDHFLFHCRSKEQSSYTDILDYLTESKRNHGERDLSALKVYFNYLIEIGKREDHPCKSMKIKREKKSVQFQELFLPEELELLLERPVRYPILKDRNRAILSLLIYQGLSSANVINLKVQDVDIDSGMIYIRSTPKLKRRHIELKPKQVLLLYRYINESRPKLLIEKTDRLFIAKLGNDLTVDSLNRMLRPLQGLFVEKNLNATTIRQSVISNWLNEQNIPLEDVQQLSGQKWLSSTEKYIRPKSEHRREMINQFFPI